MKALNDKATSNVVTRDLRRVQVLYVVGSPKVPDLLQHLQVNQQFVEKIKNPCSYPHPEAPLNERAWQFSPVLRATGT